MLPSLIGLGASFLPQLITMGAKWLKGTPVGSTIKKFSNSNIGGMAKQFGR